MVTGGSTSIECSAHAATGEYLEPGTENGGRVGLVFGGVVSNGTDSIAGTAGAGTDSGGGGGVSSLMT